MRTSILAGAFLVLAAGGYAAYQNYERVRHWTDSQIAHFRPPVAQSAPKTAKRPPAPVRIAKSTRRDVPILLEGVGKVQAVSTVEIKSRIDGQLIEAVVRDGQIVAKGDLLFRLDDRPLAAQLRLAEANLGRDQANLDKARSDVERYKSLSSMGVSPKTRLEEAQSSLASLEAAIRASQAAVDIARLNLEYATVTAPLAGRVGSVLLTAGNMVKANDAQPMLVITQTKPVNVAFTLPEKYLDEIRARLSDREPLRVGVTVPGGREISEQGTLFFLNNVVDTASGTIQVMARFENAEERLVPGQFARARVTLEVLPKAVVAPSRAVQLNQKGHYVWVVKKDQTVEPRSIEIGPRVDADTVIKTGLAPDETIVTDGQLRLFPGASVKPLDGGGKGKAKKVES